MIKIYKMGMSYYKDKIDKNSGMTEVKIITEELDKIETDKNVLIIINGIRDEVDNKLLEDIKNYDLSIFIMSDSIALETSLDIMNACDYVLHQAPNYKFEQIKAKQFYSYVPELFYKYCKNLISSGEIKVPLPIFKKDLVYFGGNNKNRDDKFKAYKVNEAQGIFSRYKLYETNEDTRLNHIDYLKELSNFSYSLVICREDYRKIGWITSRYYEAIALGNLPFIDFEYDINNHIIEDDNILRVKNYAELMNVKKKLFLNPKQKFDIFKELNVKAIVNVDNFKALIKQLVN